MSTSRLVAVLFGVLISAGCSPRTPCEAGTCAGCCAPDGVCLEGAANGACGLGGHACVACNERQSCTGGECTPLPVGDAGVDAGLVGTLWMMGNFIDPAELHVARASATLGRSELFQVPAPDGGVARFGSFDPSEDGEWFVATLALEDPARFDLYLGRTDGTELRQLLRGDGGVLLAGDYGEGVVGWWETEALELFVRPLDGGATVRATPQPWRPANGTHLFVNPSADRRYVSVVAALEGTPGAQQVWVTDLQAASPRPIAVLNATQSGTAPSGQLGAHGYALFTADGWVVFQARFAAQSGLPYGLPDGGVGNRLIRVRPDGSDLEVIPQTPTGAEQVGSWGLSVDGRMLAWSRSPGTQDYEIYRQPVDGSAAPVRISAGSHARWPYTDQPLVFSPDGRYVAFTANWARATVFEPWVVSTAGDLDLRLFAMPANGQALGRLVWSPDSQQVAFRSDHLAPSHHEAFRVRATQPDQAATRVFPIGTTAGRVLDLRWTKR